MGFLNCPKIFFPTSVVYFLNVQLGDLCFLPIFFLLVVFVLELVVLHTYKGSFSGHACFKAVKFGVNV